MKVREIFGQKTSKLPHMSVGEMLDAYYVPDKPYFNRNGDIYLGKYGKKPCVITSLEGSPEKVNADFTIDHHTLENLKYMPKIIDGNCFITNGNLDTFEGAENVEVKQMLSFSFNQFKNLHNIHKYIKSARNMSFFKNPVESHILGLLKIKNLHAVYFFQTNADLLNMSDPLAQANFIINKYLPEGDILACQQELIDGGFEEYAQL